MHAQERYFEMDLLRRRAAGELSELFGSAALEADRGARVHRFRSRVGAYFEALAPEQRAQMQRYADGVNAGMDALVARPFPYLLLGQAPGPGPPRIRCWRRLRCTSTCRTPTTGAN